MLIILRSIVGSILVALLLCITFVALAQSPQVRCRQSGNTINCRIDQPDVKQHRTEYRSITFEPNDTVLVQAGGCVQTGGHGSTWKRYLTPSGPNADRLYHGLITIPGATGVDQRIQGVVGRRLQLPPTVDPAASFLVLGYEDDDDGYADNGYSGHDDGTGGQCKQGPGRDGGPAWVTLTIEHHLSGPGVLQNHLSGAVMLQNHWKPDEYLNVQGGPPVAGAIQPGWWSARWILEPVPDTSPVSYRLKNVWKPDQYLNIESGALVASAIEPGMLSAMWIVDPVPSTSPTTYRFCSYWKRDQCLNVQQGSLVAGVIQPGWWSAMWRILSPESTASHVEGANTILDAIGPQSTPDSLLWESAVVQRMGVIGTDYKGPQEIGSAAFERASHNAAIPDFIDFWFPQKQANDHRRIVYFKRTLVGRVDDDGPRIFNKTGTFEDHDLNLDIVPNSDFRYLVVEGHKPEQSAQQGAALAWEDGRYTNNNCPRAFKVVEAEVDTRAQAKNALLALLKKPLGKDVAVYGPWIYDKGHCHQPEIHPAEQIWWAENLRPNKTKYTFSLISDASERFWWRDQMDDGTKLKPWAEPPITGVFAIAFEVSVAVARPEVAILATKKVYEVTDIDAFNVATVPAAAARYDLVHQGNVLVSFVPHNSFFTVSYEKLGLKPGTTDVLRGFLVLEATVGTMSQIATTVSIPNVNPDLDPLVVTLAAGSQPSAVDQLYERYFFQKRPGNYLFSVTQSSVLDPLPVFHQ